MPPLGVLFWGVFLERSCSSAASASFCNSKSVSERPRAFSYISPAFSRAVFSVSSVAPAVLANSPLSSMSKRRALACGQRSAGTARAPRRRSICFSPPAAWPARTGSLRSFGGTRQQLKLAKISFCSCGQYLVNFGRQLGELEPPLSHRRGLSYEPCTFRAPIASPRYRT